MAQPLTCDLCQSELAVLMQTSISDGSIMAVGAACLPQFFGGALLGVIGSDGHSGPPTKCQACRRIHERMTTPVAPIGDVSRETSEPGGEPDGPAETAESG